MKNLSLTEHNPKECSWQHVICWEVENMRSRKKHKDIEEYYKKKTGMGYY